MKKPTMKSKSKPFVQRHARWEVERDILNEPLLIRDLGPWRSRPTVTNDVEHVVKTIVAQGLLPDGRRLQYIDSEDNLDEIVVEGGEFIGFRAGPRPEDE